MDFNKIDLIPPSNGKLGNRIIPHPLLDPPLEKMFHKIENKMNEVRKPPPYQTAR